MSKSTDNLKKSRGRYIALTSKIEMVRGAWLVPSETRSINYEVRTGLKGKFCSCPDYMTYNRPCKHVHAVEVMLHARKSGLKLKTVKPHVIKKPTYPQNWKAYNPAQTHEKEMVQMLLQELCRGIVQPMKNGPGNPRIRLSDLVFGATMKVYGTLSGRRSSTDLRDCQEKKLVMGAPHYNTISKYLNDKTLTATLEALIEESAKPLEDIEHIFSQDSTGFGTYTISRWFDEKFGKKAHQSDWMKVHISVGVRTHIIAWAKVTPPYEHDTNQFPLLIQKTAKNFTIHEVVADKAYLSRKNLKIVNRLGATAYIPFKSNTTGRGPSLWQRMYHLFQYHREKFDTHYHQRSNVVTAIHMVKSKFSERVRSKNPVSQRNELLCKILCHNLCVLVQSYFELDLEPDFWSGAA
jgi:transposase/predicted nucleic acid-binding Zn finger protein